MGSVGGNGKTGSIVGGAGGEGGKGGNGGEVSVAMDGSLSTSGDEAHAVVAQSIGGGGGSGGRDSGIFGKGGRGASGGSGGQVSFGQAASGSIATTGEAAMGVLAQSVGGGGGVGGKAGGFVSVGGSGGAAADAGNVDIDISGKISTGGEGAHGIFAQSIGGGGGASGKSVGGISIGGDGGSSGKGGAVTIDLHPGSLLTTSGEDSAGIVAQSIGGGGGAARTSGGGIGIGGHGGRGGDGGTVDVTLESFIMTKGDHSYGIDVHSVGGGGGHGGGTVGKVSVGGSGGGGGAGGAANIDLKSGSAVVTGGASAPAVSVMSIGGGGGTGGNSIAVGADYSLAVGGKGGKGGNAGALNITIDGNVQTNGTHSDAVYGSSIGGGGGRGGSAISVAANIGAAAIGIGGAGGNGGSGGAVTIDASGLVFTTADWSRGLTAQSIGGGGGHGGMALTVAASAGEEFSASVAIGLGGAGGNGGSGGAITIGNTGTVVTTGTAFSTAVSAQSIGGGGGSGGTTIDVSVSGSPTAEAAGALAVGVGGSGGSGGNGGTVNISNSGEISTKGVFSYGMLAHSIGGGGGEGGSAYTGTVASAQDDSVSGSIAVGGAGGSGGDGAAVTIENSGKISTAELGSTGIMVQSIGGGGGTGGRAQAYVLSGTHTEPDETGGKAFAVALSIGGKGGNGGHGGSAIVTNSGDISTLGPMANGIFVQSVGGGGGTGGSGRSTAHVESMGSNDDLDKDVPKAETYTATVAVGGKGGKGGTGGSVTANNTGSISTADFMSQGILAQSIGGGGGAGGDAETRKFANATDKSRRNKKAKSRSLTLSVGGAGGIGGNAGSVSVQSAGNIATTGEMSSAVVAQSIGGGGGTGGQASADNLVDDNDSTTDIGITVGGSGGSAGHAGSVSIDVSGSITTQEIFSNGVFAQSVGGGGGIGGSSHSTQDAKLSVGVGGFGGGGGDGGAVAIDIDSTAAILTHGTASFGVFAQSVGGGGGYGAASLTSSKMNIGIGGNGGVGGDGGAAQVANDGQIGTTGDHAHAVFVQSVGGGGGYSGVATGIGGLRPAVDLVMGGQAGAGGDGGAVSITNSGQVATSGDHAIAILGQSIGGGGGTSGGSAAMNSVAIGMNGGDGGKGADGGAVNVLLKAGSLVATEGLASPGIFAQSVGGGGGLYGSVTEGICFGRSSSAKCVKGNTQPRQTASSGRGGKVTVDGLDNAGQDIRIQTTGDYSHGILAQSIGGGGGMGASGTFADAGTTAIKGSKGAGGDIDIALGLESVIATSGYHANGIVSQSAGADGGGQIDMNLAGLISAGGIDSHGVYAEGGNVRIDNSGRVFGGSGNGRAFYIDAPDGKAAINNLGTIGSLSGIAIESERGISISNAGVINGSILTGSATGSTFSNFTSGVFYSGSDVQANVNNDGLMNPAGAGVFGATKMASLMQSVTGSMQVDVDFKAGKSDTYLVDGNAALGGKLSPYLQSLSKGDPVTVVNAGALSFAPSPHEFGIETRPAVIYELLPDHNVLRLGIAVVDFNVNGLTYHQAAVADMFTQSFNSGNGAGLTPLILSAANSSSVPQLGAILDTAHPAQHTASLLSLAHSTHNASNNLMSCGEREGPYAAIREGECSWARAQVRETHQNATSSSVGYEDLTRGFATGVQYALDANWRLGAGLGLEESDLTSGGTFSANETRVHAGSVVKYSSGPWLFAASLGFGHGWINSTRLIPAFISPTPAIGERETTSIGGRLRAAYLFEANDWFVRPQIDLDLQRLTSHAFHEVGGGALNHSIGEATTYGVIVTPMFEIGRSIELENGGLLRPYVQFGVSRYSHQIGLEADLDGAPDGAQSLKGTGSPDTWLGRVAVGADIFAREDMELQIRYDGTFGAETRGHTGSFKFSLGF